MARAVASPDHGGPSSLVRNGHVDLIYIAQTPCAEELDVASAEYDVRGPAIGVQRRIAEMPVVAGPGKHGPVNSEDLRCFLRVALRDAEVIKVSVYSALEAERPEPPIAHLYEAIASADLNGGA